MIGYVYITENLINNKTYVGKKYGDFDPKYLGSGLILKQAIKKYGFNNFKCKVLKYCKSEKELNEKEKNLIFKLKPNYNLAEGGAGGNTTAFFDKIKKQKVIDKRRKKLKSIWKSLDKEKRLSWAKAISDAKKGKSYNRPNYRHTKETIEKIKNALKKSNFRNRKEFKIKFAAAMKKRRGIPNKKCWKPLEINNCYYPCARIACEKLKVSFPTLIKMMKNGKGGYIKI